MADDEFGEFLTTPAEHVLTPTHVISYGLSAALGAAAPIYLYMTLFNMSGEENYVIFGIVGLLTAALLAFSYNKINAKIHAKLHRDRAHFVQTSVNLGGKSRDEKKKLAQEHINHQKSVTERESMSFAILYNNLFFFAGVLILGFFLFRQVPGTYNYILSAAIAAGAVTYSSTQ